MIASNDEYLTEASNTLYDMYNDFNIRERLRSREDYIIHQQRMDKALKQQQEELAKKDSTIAEQASTITEQASALAQKDSTIAEKDSQINKLLEEIANLKASQKQ